MVQQVMTYPEGQRMQVLAPVVRSRKGEHTRLLESAQKRGKHNMPRANRDHS